MELNQLVIPCTDYGASVAFYRQLGFTEVVDRPPDYARFECDSGMTFSLVRVESIPEATGFSVYFEVDEVDLKVRDLEAAGVAFESQPEDKPWLWREAFLRDPAGNLLCIYHAGENRRFPPWRVT
jgi:hydroxymethylpyrimidine/phosphomethylpyrimidine kinase